MCSWIQIFGEYNGIPVARTRNAQYRMHFGGGWADETHAHVNKLLQVLLLIHVLGHIRSSRKFLAPAMAKPASSRAVEVAVAAAAAASFPNIFRILHIDGWIHHHQENAICQKQYLHRKKRAINKTRCFGILADPEGQTNADSTASKEIQSGTWNLTFFLPFFPKVFHEVCSSWLQP